MIARRTLRIRRGPLLAALILATLSVLASIDTMTAAQPVGEQYIEDVTIDQSQSGLRPSATAHFPESLWLSDAHWLDDHTLLVSSRVQAINLWSVAVEWWPEAVCAILVPTLLWLLARLLRRSWGQWRLTPGQPHCRICHYQLTGLVDPDRCPECGATLTPRHVVYGHHAPFGSLAAVAVLLAGLGVVYFGFDKAIPRYGWVSKVFRWPSTRAMNWAVAGSNGGFIRRHSTALARVEAVDARTGVVTRRIFSRLMFNRLGQQIEEPHFAILPDRDSILLMGCRDLLEVGIESGTLRRRIKIVEESSPAVRLRDIIVDSQGRFGCAVLSTRDSIPFDIATGTCQAAISLRDVPGWPDIPVAVLTDPPKIVSVRQRGSSPDTGHLELFDLLTGDALVSLPSTEQGDCRLAARGDKVWLFYGATLPDRYRQYAVSCTFAMWRAGEHAIDSLADVPFGPPQALDIDADGQLAALVTLGSIVQAGYGGTYIGSPQPLAGGDYVSSLVLDPRTGLILDSLRVSSSNAPGPQVAFAPHGQCLATWATGDPLAPSRPTGNYSVTFFDLRSTAPIPVETRGDAGAPTNQK